MAATAVAAVSPQYHLPLDGSTTWGGRDGSQSGPAIVHGSQKWVAGVSGEGLDISRHAYDQVTALVAEKIPKFSTRQGTVAFWFKPHWDQLDGESHQIIYAQASRWRPFRFYMVKGRNGVLDLSFAPSRQIQFLRRDMFKKERWTHLAFTWDARNGAVCLYVDGRLVERKENPAAFDFPDAIVDLTFQCGSGTDRFKANVGNGVYDDIRFYDEVLAETDIFLLATGGQVAPMVPVRMPGGNSFSFSFTNATLPSAAPVLRFHTAGGATFTLAAMGLSRQISLSGTAGGMSGRVTSADTLDLRKGYTLTFNPSGKRMSFLIDGAEQGTIELDREAGGIVSMEAVDGILVGAPRHATPHRPPPATASELPLWTLEDASRRESGARSAVSLNGYWRVWPVDDYLGAPPEDAPGYMRVPGSFRSPLWNIHRLDPATRTIDAGTHSWKGRDLQSYRAAWYEREIRLPPGSQGKEGRLWLVFDHFNADTGRIFWNGELVHSFRQDFKSFTMVPHRVRVDVTDRLAADGRNALRLYVDRHFTGLWRGVPAIGDHGEICQGDVWLERTPSQLHIVTAVALPSWRQKNVTMRVRVANPSGERGEVSVQGVFSRGETGKTCEKTIRLDGTGEQVVVWTEPWPDPVPWSAEDPQTYGLEARLARGARIIDTLSLPRFGFREAWVEKGELYLNGVHLRLRMWTSPGLHRLRYYYGHPDAIDQYVAYVKELNYDTVRNEPWRKGSIVGLGPYLDSCDRLGLYNLHQMPTYEDEPAAEYAAEVERFLEAYGGHPSILMWYTDFNTCGYAWDQDPAKLTDVTYDPPAKRHARRRARTAEATMRALDPSRELFQHAGGNSGRIFTSMNYQSYGTPLQEQEDWPAQWAKGHVQPLMVVESAFPFPGQFEHFSGGGAQEHLGAEHAARYFGPSVFAAERYPVPHSSKWCWTVDAATGDDPNMMRLSACHYTRVVRAWRGYGVSAIGDFPGGRDHTRTAQTFDSHRVVYRDAGGDPKSPGLKPEATFGYSEVQRHILADYSRPDYLHATVKACFAPLLVFAGGDPDDFTSKDHAFFAGERFRKSIVAVNDHLRPVTISYTWTCGAESGKGTFGIPAGGIVREPIRLAAPEVSDKTYVELSIAWRCADAPGGQVEGRDSLVLSFFPKRRASLPAHAQVTLYDPLGHTASVLKRAGVAFARIDKLDGLPPVEHLVVGQGAFASAPLAGDLPAAIRNALVFEQPTNALRRFVMSAPSCREAFVARSRSEFLEGLEDADLANWRGASDTVPAFLVSDEHTPHYPRSKWKCGNGGIVSGCAIRRPSRGNFRTVVSCGFNLESAALLDETRSGGRTIWCQMDVTCRYGKDPAATRLVDNMLMSFLSSETVSAANSMPVFYLGSDKDAVVLRTLGADLAAWDGRTSGTVVVLPGVDLSRLPFAHTNVRRLDFRAAVPDNPAFAGVSPADCYFRTANALPVQAFAVRRSDGSRFVLLGIGPDGTVHGLWNDEKLARVWSTVLDNLGARLTPETPYLPGLDIYDGDAFHNW